jgi:hypothetical protein
MTNRFIPRAISFAMAAMMTFTMLASIDGLAFSEHAANGLMAQATVEVQAA